MRTVVCPHCKAHRIVTTNIHQDMIVVIPCPGCHELVVLFRHRAAALSRTVLEQGTRAERCAHLAEIIDVFVEPGIFPPEFAMDGFIQPEFDAGRATRKRAARSRAQEEPITKQEVERFIRVDLKRIDDPAYFRKHLG